MKDYYTSTGLRIKRNKKLWQFACQKNCNVNKGMYQKSIFPSFYKAGNQVKKGLLYECVHSTTNELQTFQHFVIDKRMYFSQLWVMSWGGSEDGFQK